MKSLALRLVRSTAKFIRYLHNQNQFVLIWILNLLICELLLTNLYLQWCSFPAVAESNQVNAILIADPQLTDAYSYKQHGIVLRLTEFYSDIYMKRNFRKIMKRMNPQMILFIGDLMDGGREWGQEQFDEELKRFKNIFQYDYDKIVTIGVAGNHDIGFGLALVESAHERFLKHVGEVNSVKIVADHAFIAVDTIALSGNPDSKPYQDAFKFLQSVRDLKHDPTKRIMLTHVPLYRPEGADCGPRRHFEPIKNRYGYQYQNEIQPHIAKYVLDIVQPELVLSGDDHDDCVHLHQLYSKPTLEHTIGTFSWLQGNMYPSFGVMSFRPDKETPIKPKTPSFQLEICSLPPQLNIYIWYIALFGICCIGNLASAFQSSRLRSGSRFIGTINLLIAKTLSLMINVLPFYLLIILYNWFI